MEIISESEVIETVYYELFFGYVDGGPHDGFGFPATADGLDLPALERRPAALENYKLCLDGTHQVKPGRLIELKHRYRQPAVGKCSCGCEVTLDGFTNTCDRCERDYNSGGQLLAPRSQWGEETGEAFCDLQDI